MGVGQGEGILFLVSLKFSASSTFFCEFGKFCEFLWVLRLPWSLLRDWLHNQASGGEKDCIVYSLFSIFIIIIIIFITTTIIIIHFFVFLLNCLYLNPQVLLFVHSPPHPTAGVGGERAALWCLVVSCQLKPWHRCKVLTAPPQHQTAK